ncbi:MAG: hypothetical protein ACLT9S_01265 [Faecalibacterium sp.]
MRQLSQRGADAEILEFDSGEAFLAAEKEQRFTAAFLDIYMDGLSGMDAARGTSENRCRLPSGFYHHLDRPRTRGLSGAGISLSGQALFRGRAVRSAG